MTNTSTIDLINQYADAYHRSMLLAGIEPELSTSYGAAAASALTEIEHRLSPPPRRFLVWSDFHHAWWGPNRRGYCKDDRLAGRYTHDEAVDICRPQPDRLNVSVLAPECWDQPIRVGRDIAGELEYLVSLEVERVGRDA